MTNAKFYEEIRKIEVALVPGAIAPNATKENKEAAILAAREFLNTLPGVLTSGQADAVKSLKVCMADVESRM